MIFVYRKAPSSSASDLARSLGAVRYRALSTPMERRAKPGDTVICWGQDMGPVPNVRVLNGARLRSKFLDATILKVAGVPTIEATATRPDPIALNMYVQAFLDGLYGFSPVLTSKLRASITQLLTVTEEWLPRLNSHMGGDDLLFPPPSPDFWVRKESIVDEYRVHSFLGRSIRAGRKVPRELDENGEPVPAHPWIRSWQAGWRISYGAHRILQSYRDIAHAACKALDLDFGAVDIGITSSGTPLVLEVNRAPGLSDGTAEVYANAINLLLEPPHPSDH